MAKYVMLILLVLIVAGGAYLALASNRPAQKDVTKTISTEQFFNA